MISSGCEAVRESKLSKIENGLAHINESLNNLTRLRQLLANGDSPKEATENCPCPPKPQFSTADMLSNLPDNLHGIATSIEDEINNIKELLL